MRLRLAIILAFVCVPSFGQAHAQSPSAATDTQLELKARGAKNSSPITQSIVGAEYGDPKIRENERTAQRVAKQVEKLRAQNATPPPNDSFNTRVTAISDMVSHVDATQETYNKKRYALEGIKEGHETVTALTPLFGGAKTKLALKLGAHAGSMSFKEITESYAKQIKTDYESGLENAIVLAVLQTDEAVAAKWAQRGVTDSTKQAALRDLFGPQNEFFDDELVKELGPGVKADLANAKADMVQKALARYKAHTDAEMSSLRQAVKAKHSKFMGTAKEITEFKEQISANTKAIVELKSYTEKQFVLLNSKIGIISGQVDAMQSAMWRQMSPADQVRALDDGFFPKMDSKERDKLRSDLVSTANVMNYRDNALKTLAAAGQLANLAATAGLPVDVYNFNRNIETASAAVNIISGIALGGWSGWLTVLQSTGGLFPGGQNAEAEQHKEIIGALKEITRLQYITIQKLDDLRFQLNESTAKIMSELKTLEDKADVANQLILAQTLERYEGCGTFVRKAEEKFGMKNGIFPSYADRTKHFDSDINRIKLFDNCREFLSGRVNKLVASATGDWGENANNPLTIVHPLLLAGTAGALQDQSEPTSAQSRLSRMRELTLLTLGIYTISKTKDEESKETYQVTKEKQNCYSRLLSGLAIAPEHFANLQHSAFVCLGEDIDRPHISDERCEGALCTRAGDPVSPNHALGRALAPAMVRQLGEYMLFFSPYMEIIKQSKEPNRIYKMLNESELLNGVSDRGLDGGEVRDWPEFYLDVLNLALAQESLHSGLLITKRSADILGEANYGTTVELPPLDLISKKDANGKIVSCTPSAEIWKKFPYALTVCFLQDSIPFRLNISYYLVGSKLNETNTTIPAYAFALASDEEVHLKSILPGLPLVQGIKDNKPWWHLKLVYPDKNGKSDFLIIPLPSAAEIQTNQVAYRPAAYLLRALRDSFVERIALLNSAEESKEHKVRLRQITHAALDDPSFARVNFTVEKPSTLTSASSKPSSQKKQPGKK
ncbi:hypothetical protein SAMN05216386_1700 [Nitrosospira briensis]|uniref:Uncharacterized protein n=1 Tax=Nitrosospira briensis TaxID=35799 RepID=A0A1I5BJW1_9PROT|nr:hypothetical protein [Nitrosospira briensis]SFN74946.1 hypothetical protein SAMN05216386_1700 [Nitrosospira briensis]